METDKGRGLQKTQDSLDIHNVRWRALMPCGKRDITDVGNVVAKEKREEEEEEKQREEKQVREKGRVEGCWKKK